MNQPASVLSDKISKHPNSIKSQSRTPNFDPSPRSQSITYKDISVLLRYFICHRNEFDTLSFFSLFKTEKIR